MKPNIWKAGIGGFIGTVILTLAMRSVPATMGVRIDIVDKLGQITHTGMAGGLLLHFLNGTVIFPLIYVYREYQFLPGAPWQRGLLWGLILWLGWEIVMMPTIGGGLFSREIGGIKAVIPALIGHLVYGVVFGVVAGRPPVARR